jgi:hypothetical protein
VEQGRGQALCATDSAPAEKWLSGAGRRPPRRLLGIEAGARHRAPGLRINRSRYCSGKSRVIRARHWPAMRLRAGAAMPAEWIRIVVLPAAALLAMAFVAPWSPGQESPRAARNRGGGLCRDQPAALVPCCPHGGLTEPPRSRAADGPRAACGRPHRRMQLLRSGQGPGAFFWRPNLAGHATLAAT